MEVSQEQSDFEELWFKRYDCADVIGNWEILAYAMLLEHASDLLSDESPESPPRPRGGRKTEWGAERLKLLASEVERVRTAPGAPSARQSAQGALRYLLSLKEFREKLGLKSPDPKTVKTLANRLSEAENCKPPGIGETPIPGS